MIPLIGSICRGPLDICQLPRTWWKVLTRQKGLLDESYPDNSGGLDTWCLEALDLDVDEVYSYLRETLPDYVTFESWIVDRRNGEFDRAKIERFNEILLYRRHIRPRKIVETYADIGYDLATDTETSALLLNTLQDWQLFHKADFSAGDVPSEMPPLISSMDVGPLGVVQLPRTWHKVLMSAKGFLNTDYPACGGGLDQKVLDALGLDREKVVDYLSTELPSYTQFEAWVTREVGEIDKGRVAEFKSAMTRRGHPEPKLSDIHDRTGCDRTIKNGVLLNHLEDWRYAYDLLIAI
jgi:hypothetical protein